MKKSKPEKKRKRFHFLTLLMLAVMLVSGGVNGYCIYQIFGKAVVADSIYTGMSGEEIEIKKQLDFQREQEQENKKSGKISYIPFNRDGNNLDEVIAGEDDAYDVLLKIQGNIGITDAQNEYKYAYMCSNDYYDTYTMQQYYNGIEVYGYTLKMIADKSGNLLSVNGTHAQLDGFDTSVSLSESDAYNYVEKYLKSEYQVTKDEVEIKSLGKKITVSEDNISSVGYLFSINDNEWKITEIMINSNSGDVIFDNCQISGAMESRDLQGRQVMQTLDVNVNDTNGDIELYDSVRDMFVTDGYINGNYRLADGSDPFDVDFLANMQRAYDFYNNVFNFHRGSYALMVNDLAKERLGPADYNLGKNARTGRCFDENASVTSLSSKKDYATYLDIMGHEYTHAMLPENIAPNTALNEGLADIFGELIEDYSGEGACNWVMGGGDCLLRDIRNPHNTGNVENMDKLKKPNLINKEVYYKNSTIISHSAYLMTQGINNTEPLTTEQLGKLYFNTWNNIYSSDFKDFRQQIQLTALLMNGRGELSDEQLESVIDSFDDVLIERSPIYLGLTPDAVVNVMDANGELYSDYEYTISKLGSSVVSSGTGTVRLNNINHGIYRLVLSDMNTKGITNTHWLIVNDNANHASNNYQRYNDTATIETNFNSKEKEIVLALDCSGSMEGTPIAETKKAALNFINTIFNINPNVKVNIIKYSNEAICFTASSDPKELRKEVNKVRAGGGTNTYDAVSSAKSILEELHSENKFFIMMSDGIPTEFPDMADISGMKEDDVTICTLGFFHKLSGSELNDGISFMNSMASVGYYYNVQDTADLQAVFNDIARQVGGERFAQVRIACPVDVTVRYNGETLSSAEDNLNTRTGFGSLSFEGEDNEVKILRLDEDADYEICITGTGEGTMDYTISFADKNGDYTDIRTFEDIPITPDTVISTNSRTSRYTTLNVDTDGNGKFDLHYYAGKNHEAKNRSDTILLIVCIISGLIFVSFVTIKIVIAVKRYRKNTKCSQCGVKLSINSEFCPECGMQSVKVPLFASMAEKLPKQKKAFIITQLAVIGVCGILTLCVTSIYHSAANTVFMQIQKYELVSASVLYDNSVADSKIAGKYLDLVVMPYLKKLETAESTQNISKSQADSVYMTIYNMNLGSSSDYAEKLLGINNNNEENESNEEE